MNLFDLNGKNAFVTGGKGLLAPIWVETLAEAGCSVYTFDLPHDDVTNKSQLLHEALSLPPMDIIVNNAGIDNAPDTKSTFFGNCENILAVNLQGAVNVCEAFIPKMIKTGGVIINIGSIQGRVGADYRLYPSDFEKPLGYSLSKASLPQLSRSIAVQYGRYNIRSVTISFGGVESPKHTKEFKNKYLNNVPLKRFVTKISLQTTLLYACCTPELTGQEILVDSGYTSI